MKDDTGFLRDIIANPNDPVPRLIYADWLDEHGDIRGEFLRLEVHCGERETSLRQRRQIRARLRQLRQGICQTWLARLDRAAVENCGLRFQFECPKRWEALQEADEGRVRFCDACQKRVYHCATVEEAREHALRGECVAVDSRLIRAPGDLGQPHRLVTVGVVGVDPASPHTRVDSEEESNIRLHIPSEDPEEYRPTREQRRRERQASRERRQRRHKRDR